MQPPSPLRPPLPRRSGDRIHWEGLRGSSRSLAIAAAAREFPGLTLVIAPDAATADALRTEIGFFAGNRDEPAEAGAVPIASAGEPRPAPDRADGGSRLPLLLPDRETLPYDALSPHQDIVSERLATLHALPGTRDGVLVVAAATLMGRVAPRGFVEGNALVLAVGDRLDLEAARRRLDLGGYRCVSQVMEHGEFAVRGSLLDLFPTGAERPYRIDLFDAEVETIRTFDPESQRSLDGTDSIRLLPAREFPLDPEAIGRFRAAWRARFEGNPNACPVYRDVSEGFAPAGVEYWLPLFFDRTGTVFDYLPEATLVVELPGVRDQAEAFWRDTAERYEQRRHDAERPVLGPRELFLAPDELGSALAARPRALVREEPDDALPDEGPFGDPVEDRAGDPGARAEPPAPCSRPPPPAPRDHAAPTAPADRSRARGRAAFGTANAPALPADARASEPFALFKQFLERFAGRVLILVESPGRMETLVETLRRHHLRPHRFAGWSAFLHDREERRFGVVLSEVERGVILDDPAVAILPEALLFGRRAAAARRRRARARDAESVIRDLTELQPGDAVVHERHGVGRYRGLVTPHRGRDHRGVPQHRVRGPRPALRPGPVPAPRVALRGGPSARPCTSSAARSGRRPAGRRPNGCATSPRSSSRSRPGARRGPATRSPSTTGSTPPSPKASPSRKPPTRHPRSGRPSTTFEATGRWTASCAGTWGSARRRSRCGPRSWRPWRDGRSRSSFPPPCSRSSTTRRSATALPNGPVRIEQLSRFRSRRHREEITRELREGRIDVVIGTHRLLQDDVGFRRLGLVIVDEEHRFGVRQKERLKALRAEVDVLTLTATPIPRTLNLALSALRDLSLIATAPERRLSIRTFVGEWRPEVIRESVLREIRRGGQVYFVHNRVEDIDEIAGKVEDIVPEAELRVAHGQMRERDLEQVMLDFYHRRFNVLVCTTIIESGIDVPTANTIVINRADRFGLAQLHQLRGRVGRSHQRAYAYLFAPDRRSMTPDAVKRLDAIESLDDLGIGFSLAMHDLEIRGAGELLGEDQSGQIEAIGYSLYTEMLERAVADLRVGRDPALDRPLDHGTEVDLHVPALIPEDYLPDVHARLILYKRIAGERSEEGLRELEVEMIDRFGSLPPPAKTLLRITARKLRAAPLGIRKIDLGAGGGRVTFGERAEVDPARVVALLQSHPRRFGLDGERRMRVRWELPDLDARLEAIDHIVTELGAPREAA